MTLADTATALPDPIHDAACYDSVPAKRLFAWLVDSVLVGMLCLLALPFTLFLGLLVLPLMWLGISFAYRWATLAGGSATWGMRLAAIEIRDHRMARLDATGAFLHTLAYSVQMAVFPLQLISVALMLATPRRQGLHDHLLGTAALNRPALA